MKKKICSMVMLVMLVGNCVPITEQTLADTVKESGSTLCQQQEDKSRATGINYEFVSKIGQLYDEKLEQNGDVVCAGAGQLPSYVDNSTGENGKYFPPIGDQGQIGSCVAWADTYYTKTYMMNRFFERQVDEGNTYSPKWAHANMAWLKGGVSIERCPLTNFTASNSLLGNDFPADCEADYQKSELGSNRASVLAFNGEIDKNKTFDIENPNSADLLAIKEALAEGEVLEFGTYIYWFNYAKLDGALCSENKKFAKQKIVTACAGTKGSIQGNHLMTIVGYNDKLGVDLNKNGKLEDGEMGAFKVVNSWGDWCNQGTVWVAYDAFNKTSSLSDIGTGDNEVRVSIAGQIIKMDLDEERIEHLEQQGETDCYVRVEMAAKEKGFAMKVAHPYAYATIPWKYQLEYERESAFVNNTNYKGSSGVSDAELVYELCDEDREFYVDKNVAEAKNMTIARYVVVDNLSREAFELTKEAYYDEENKRYVYNTFKVNQRLPFIFPTSLEEIDGKVSGQFSIEAPEGQEGQAKKIVTFEHENGKDKGEAKLAEDGSFSFSPKYKGYYRVKLSAKYEEGGENHKTLLIKVTGVIEEEHLATIYYGKKDWSKAYMHYCVDGGQWTKTPGVAMEKNSEYSGYSWKYQVKLGQAKGITMCFNNGSGSWDNNSKRNYQVGEGTYTIKDGKIKEIKQSPNPTQSPVITATPKPTEEVKKQKRLTVYYKASSSWSTAYIHYKVGNGSWTKTPGVKMEATKEKSGYNYKAVINLSSASSATVCFTNGKGSWDSNGASNYKLKEGTYGIKSKKVTKY